MDWCKGEGAGLDGGGLSVWESGGGEREGGIGGLDGGGAVPEPWGEAESVGVCGAGDPVGGGGILAGGDEGGVVAWGVGSGCGGTIQRAGASDSALACHGLVDGAWGNLFGPLALTLGGNGEEASDDGFLTLGKIYQLRLGGGSW